MTPQIATIIFALGIWGLFVLDREREARVSRALWIPVCWLLINGSRPVSMWLGMGPIIDSPDQYLDGSPVDALVWAILLLGGLIVLLSRKRRVRKLLRGNGPILLFFLYCALSILWSDYPFVAFKRWTKAVGDIVMVLVILSDPEWFTALKRFLARAGFLLVPLSVMFIKYYPDLGRGYNAWAWTPEYNGVTTSKNTLGMVCLVCGLAFVWRLLVAYQAPKGTRRVRQLIAHGIPLALAIWLFTIANSMTSLSCFVMGGALIVMTSLFRWARRPAVVHLLVAAAVALSVCALFFDPGGTLVGVLGRNPTLTGRTTIWQVVLEFAGNPLFGTGFESFWLGDRLQRIWEMTAKGMKGIQEAHNGYLEVYLNLGWTGASLLALIMVTSYRNVVTALRRHSDLGSLALAYFFVAVVYNFTEAGFRMMAPVWLAFLLTTMAVPHLRSPKARTLTAEPSETPFPRRPAAARA